MGEKYEGPNKRSPKKFWGTREKPRGGGGRPRAANPCPALGGWSAYFGDLLDIGGMILRSFISGFCYVQSHAFSTHFLQIFLDDLFFARQAFVSHFLYKCLKSY